MKKLLLAFFCVAGATTMQAQIQQLLADTSTEASGSGSGPWSSTSTNFGTVLCDIGSCGDCGGPCGPATGTWYAWFGGAGGADELGTLTQTFNVAQAGPAALRFMYYLPINSGVAVDSIYVTLDGNTLWLKTALDSAQFNSAYTPVTVLIPALAAGAHTLEFVGHETGTGTNAFNALVDDITIWQGTGIGYTEYSLEEGVTISQNVQASTLNVALNLPKTADLNITITDMFGKVIATSDVKGAKNNYITFNTFEFAAGVYNITINNGHSKLNRKVFIQR